MVYRQVCEILTPNQLIIQLPKSFSNKKKVMVILDDEMDSFESKMELMKKAQFDAQFQSDIAEITDDFDNTDAEIE